MALSPPAQLLSAASLHCSPRPLSGSPSCTRASASIRGISVRLQPSWAPAPKGSCCPLPTLPLPPSPISSAICARSPIAAASAAAMTEPATGIAFPPTFTPPGLSTELSLLGAGVREKTFAIVSVKVYAVAIYLDPTALPLLSGKSGQNLLDALAQAPADKAIVITLARDVTSKQFLDALDDGLKPRLEAQGADVALIQNLRALFEGGEIKKDSGVILAWKQPSSLVVSTVDDVKGGYSSGASPRQVDSLPLVKALYDIYLGTKPSSPALQASIAASFSS